MNSPSPKKAESSVKIQEADKAKKANVVEKATVEVPAAEEGGEDRRRRSYALTGGKRPPPVRQSTLLVGSQSFYGGVATDGGDTQGKEAEEVGEKEGWLWKVRTGLRVTAQKL